MKTRDIVLAAIGSIVLLLGASAAGADEPSVVQTRRVSLAGLDPTAPRDVAALYVRLRDAARSVCTFSAVPSMYSRACAEEALDSAVRTVGWPLLAEVRGGGTARTSRAATR